MLKLSPPLSVIEATLFDASPFDESAPDATLSPAPAAPPPLPAHLAAKIRQRAACQARAWPSRPEPGLIARIDRDLPQPLAVLLSEPTSTPDLWHGWLMAWETDYASHRDLILDERDEPRDPLAAMVQAWNPVQLHWPTASAVLGRLAPERLAAVRDLALELDTNAPGRAGTLVQRVTRGGHLVLTGAPLGDGEDPRWRYRALYAAAADLVRDLARQAGAAPRAWWRTLLDALREGARAADLTLAPMPVPALGPAETDSQPVWRLADWIEWRLIPDAHGDSARIQARLVQSAPLLIGLARGARLLRLLGRGDPRMDRTRRSPS